MTSFLVSTFVSIEVSGMGSGPSGMGRGSGPSGMGSGPSGMGSGPQRQICPIDTQAASVAGNRLPFTSKLTKKGYDLVTPSVFQITNYPT